MSSNPFRSTFEQNIAQALSRKWLYEPLAFPYTIKHMYTPDFVYQGKKKRSLWVEAKGYFRPGDAQKYKAIRDELKNNSEYNAELAFFFQNALKKVSKGSKTSMGDWALKEGFEFFEVIEDLEAYVNGHF